MCLFRLYFVATLAISAWGSIVFDAPNCLGAVSLHDELAFSSWNTADLEILSVAGAPASPLLQTDSVAVLPGDADFDGTVSFADLNALLSQYGLPGTWSSGDFSGDGFVDFVDLNTLLSNYGKSLPTLSEQAAVVPEPTSGIVWACVVCLVGSVELFRRQAIRRKTILAGCSK